MTNDKTNRDGNLDTEIITDLKTGDTAWFDSTGLGQVSISQGDYLYMYTQRLFQQMHQDDDPNWRRASGNMYCFLCLKQYREHPYFDEQLCFEHPIDHRLCNGDVVHL